MDDDRFFYELGCGTPIDCNDADPTSFPGATESCDGHDEDCDGLVDNAPQCYGSCAAIELNTTINMPPTNRISGAFVWSGSSYGIAWTATQQDIVFSALDSNGNVLIPPTLLAVDPVQEDQPSLVWNGSDWALAWRRNTNICFNTIDSSGVVGMETCGLGGHSPSLAWNGSEYGLVRSKSPGAGKDELYFARLDPQGHQLGNDIQISDFPEGSLAAQLVWAGDSYGLVWVVAPDVGFPIVYFLRLNPNGTPIGQPISLSDPRARALSPTVAWNGSGYAVAWDQSPSDSGGDEEIYFTTLDELGTPDAPPVAITNANDRSEAPSLTWTGEEYHLVWHDYRLPPPRIYHARLSSIGSALHDHLALEGSALQMEPTVAWTGSALAVARFAAVSSGVFSVRVSLYSCNCFNDDGDAFTVCSGDCGDMDPTVYPGAPQICDGLNNDCADPDWPQVSSSEEDFDNDGYFVCTGDCDDDDPHRSPATSELCNGVDDNCNTMVDEDSAGEDTDTDSIHNACDNCPSVANPAQLDTDYDTIGNACDNCATVPNSGQADDDSDERGNACDNCPTEYNFNQDDFEGDGVGDACDNCLYIRNSVQTDRDDDSEGDHCDIDDGMIYITFAVKGQVRWQQEVGYSEWNAYRGDLDVLRATGTYTQLPGSNSLAHQQCGLTQPSWSGIGVPAIGKVAFFLVTGMTAEGESGLGTDSAGVPRPHDNPCP